MDIQTRLDRLERENRYLRRGLMGIVLVLAVTVSTGVYYQNDAPDVIKAKRFQLVDDDGKLQGEWFVNTDPDSGKRVATIHSMSYRLISTNGTIMSEWSIQTNPKYNTDYPYFYLENNHRIVAMDHANIYIRVPQRKGLWLDSQGVKAERYRLINAQGKDFGDLEVVSNENGEAPELSLKVTNQEGEVSSKLTAESFAIDTPMNNMHVNARELAIEKKGQKEVKATMSQVSGFVHGGPNARAQMRSVESYGGFLKLVSKEQRSRELTATKDNTK